MIFFVGPLGPFLSDFFRGEVAINIRNLKIDPEMKRNIIFHLEVQDT